jgi:SAM-dependent methyltransferase
MSDHQDEASALETIYQKRFAATWEYRRKVWRVLNPCFFKQFIPSNSTVLDLGCGYGEFINSVEALKKYGLDLNPESGSRLDEGVTWLQLRSTDDWGIAAESLDAVFTSNFFEHLRCKEDLELTIDRVNTYLKPGGLLIAMGPNINLVPGSYWDFWDHHLALTEKSLSELLGIKGFEMVRVERCFLPYTMVGKRPAPVLFVRLYLALPFLWRIFGKQFLVIARKK